MRTEIDIKPTDISIVPRQTPSERLNMDIMEEMKNRSRSVKLYKNDKKRGLLNCAPVAQVFKTLPIF